LIRKDVAQELNQFFLKCSNTMHEFQRLTIQHSIPDTLNRQDEFSSFGYILLLQLWTLHQKQVSPANLQALAASRSQEQVRALVYKTQVWTLSRVGYLDVRQGLLVWKHLLLPVLNTKPFSQLSLNYLNDVLSR
jgi:hypothetical protein